jgi:hypothetical protein
VLVLQLGVGDYVPRNIPTCVPLPKHIIPISVFAGAHDSYAVVENIDSASIELWRWGLVEEHPEFAPHIAPKPVFWTSADVSRSTRIALGEYFGVMYGGSPATLGLWMAFCWETDKIKHSLLQMQASSHSDLTVLEAWGLVPMCNHHPCSDEAQLQFQRFQQNS